MFQDVDFNNKERFPDALLEKLLQHFEAHRLRKADVEPDMLGQAYEYLIERFADDSGKKGGEFYTPKMVVRLIVECLKPDEGMSIYDPTCGSGGMLLEAAHHLERQGKNPKSIFLFGQEKNLNTWAICQMNLFLHDIDDAKVARGDTLLEPKHLTGEGVAEAEGHPDQGAEAHVGVLRQGPPDPPQLAPDLRPAACAGICRRPRTLPPAPSQSRAGVLEPGGVYGAGLGSQKELAG